MSSYISNILKRWAWFSCNQNGAFLHIFAFILYCFC